MTKEVKVVVSAEASRFQKGMSDAEKATSKLHSALDRFGPIGRTAANVLEKLGFSSVGTAAGVGVAAAAIGASVAIAEKAISRYVELGEKVRHYSEITGQSAEASTRQVIAFQELGVDAETVAASMFRLGRNSATASEKLAAVSVEVVKNADGTTNLNETLLNVIKAYHSTGDAAQKDLIVFTAFGRAGAAMIPILESNADELKRIEGAIGKVYTAQDLKRIRDYTISQKQAQESADEWSRSLGEALLPASKAVYDSLNENVYVNKRMAESHDAATAAANRNRGAGLQLAQTFRQEYRDAQQAKSASDQLADAQRQAAAAAKADADEQDKLYTSIHKGIDANFAAQQAELDLKKAEQAVIDTKGQDAEANLRLNEAIVRLANDTVAAAEANAENAGATLTAQQKTDLFNQSLRSSDAQIGANNADVHKYIGSLLSIPAVVSTSIRLYDLAAANRVASGHGAIASYDEGGTVPGPVGSPQLAVVHGGETVTPPGKGGINVMIHIGTYVGNADQLSKMLAHELRISGAFR